ncbi:hypothetical protein Bcsk_007320 [Bartonella sp. CDC_skunk]|uniref:hypothetical protein n=1 Tax=Bartonella sp. CDC_skunk TaxID=1933905 RepID=UPI00099AB9AE|nr:hypothetical protein [Bartonella sp. CDC_skunk]AQX21374.1 hypothetical protein Bcsk_007320 [Bartonella sp. CDC_skunk]
MKEKNMINLKAYSDINSENYGRSFLKRIYYYIKDLALIGALNGSLSGAVAAILANYGYISLPGFGPIIAIGIRLTLPAGIIIGITIGSVIGIIISIIFKFLDNCNTFQ